MEAVPLRQLYLDKCRDFLAEPVPVVLDVLDGEDAGEPCVELMLNGNRDELFTSRLSYMQVFAVSDVLSSLKKVSTLDLSYNDVDDAGAKALGRGIAATPNLTTLVLRGNALGAQGVASLVEGLGEAAVPSALAKLDLNLNPLGDAGGVVLAKFLETNTTLSSLDVGNCEFGDVTVIALCSALCADNATLKSLNMENPRIRSIEDETCVHIAKMLARNSTLTSLDLGKHRIRDHGCHTLVDYGLTRNKTLRRLNLRCNELSEQSGSAIHRLLTEHPELTWLDLSSNRFATRGASEIAQALPLNNTLAHLDVRSNGIESDGIIAIADNAERSSRLASLLLWGNHIGMGAAEAIMNLVTYRAEEPRHLVLDVEPYEVGERVCVAKSMPSEQYPPELLLA